MQKEVHATEVADTIYLGGPILTIDDKAPRAEAVAVADGLILAVGGRDIASLQDTLRTWMAENSVTVLNDASLHQPYLVSTTR